MKRERVLPVNVVTGLAEGGEGEIGRLRKNGWMSKAGFNRRGGPGSRVPLRPPPPNPVDLLLVMRRVFVLTNNFSKRLCESVLTFPLFSCSPRSLFQTFYSAGYELNTIGSFEVCPTNWQCECWREKVSFWNDWFFSFPSFCCFYSFRKMSGGFCGALGGQVVWMNGDWLAGSPPMNLDP